MALETLVGWALASGSCTEAIQMKLMGKHMIKRHIANLVFCVQQKGTEKKGLQRKIKLLLLASCVKVIDHSSRLHCYFRESQATAQVWV